VNLFAGNTCFINSVLQVLYRTPGFVKFVSEVAVEVQLATHLHSLLDDDNVSSVGAMWTLEGTIDFD